MSLWLRIILALISIYFAVRFGAFSYNRRSWEMGSYSLSLFFLGLHHAGVGIAEASNLQNITLQAALQVSEWSSITAIAFLLCGLLQLIRESKPGLARFPLIFTGLPLLIIISYPFAHEADIINRWLLKLYEGAGLVVGLIMYGYFTYTKKRKKYLYVLVGIVLLSAAYVLHWFLGFISFLQPWSWLLLFIIGIVILYKGLSER